MRQQQYPEKSFYSCFLNVVLIPVRMIRYGPYKDGRLTLEKAMSYAMKKTGLSDFGDTRFIQNYNAIFSSAAHQALKLSNLGYVMYRIELNMTMVRRLKLLNFVKEIPAIKDIPVRSPVFVMGLPRTGTTFLHRLLSLDPKVRSPLLWELLAPVPAVSKNASDEELRKDNDKRRKFIRKLIADRQSFGDKALQHIHEIGADLPEECIMALTDELPVHMSCLYSVYLNWEKLFSETPEIDGDCVTAAYAYYKQVLQILSYQIGEAKDPRRWMLKCPIHLYYTKEIARIFPDARLIWTHRHPVSAVPSLCSLVKSLSQVYYENESRDDALLGKKVRDLSAKYLLQCVDDIEKSKLPCSHIHYEELTTNPIGVVKSIYKENGWEFSAEYESILEKYLQKNKEDRERAKQEQAKSKDVLHHYTPEEFSLTAEELTSGNFEKYVQMFKVPMSKN
eukprot:gene31477-38045_t